MQCFAKLAELFDIIMIINTNKNDIFATYLF